MILTSYLVSDVYMIMKDDLVVPEILMEKYNKMWYVDVFNSFYKPQISTLLHLFINHIIDSVNRD